MSEEKAIELPPDLILVLLFIAIFFFITLLLLPGLRQGLFYYIFSSLKDLGKLFGGI
jgi:hypothetical protein